MAGDYFELKAREGISSKAISMRHALIFVIVTTILFFVGACEQVIRTPKTYDTGTRSGMVVDAITGLPVAGVVVVYSWDIGVFELIESSHRNIAVYEAITDANGRYSIPKQIAKVEYGMLLASDLGPEDVIAYKFGYVYYYVHDGKPGAFMEYVPDMNQKYQKKNNIIKLQPWNDNLSHREHIEVVESRSGFNLPRPKLEEAFGQERAIAKKEKLDNNGFDRQAYQIGQKMGEDRRRYERGEIDQTQYIKLLKARLESKNVQEVASAASELNKFGDKSGVEPLIKSLKARLYRRDFGRVLGVIIKITCRGDLKRFFDNNIISERLEAIQDLEDWWIGYQESFSLIASDANSKCSWLGPSVDFRHGNLKVSENKHFLMHDDGTPFFYLGDTAWELFHRINREEAERYLENRRAKGFTVIQAVALAEFDGLEVPNAYGQRPLLKTDGKYDPTKPDIKEGADDYWGHVDWIIDRAAEKGLYVGLLPTWGDKVDKKWGIGPVIFDVDNARIYGQWIGNRYKDKVNIIWIIGGDRPGGGENKPVWDALAEGIKSVDSHHLMTFHPMGGSSSSEWFQKSDWLNFNMFQSGHNARNIANYKMIRKDYRKEPIKPCLDGEPRYEDHPVKWDPNMGWFDDSDVRQAVYWSVFAGGCGVTYGCHNIWQFYDKGREPISAARHYWIESLDLPGACQILYLRRLMESRPMLSRVPDSSLLIYGQTDDPQYIVATRGDDYAFIYFPYGYSFKTALGKISGKTVKAYWFNPRNGESIFIGKFENSGDREFEPPEQTARGNDWVLVLDDSSKNYAPPGVYVNHQ